VVHRQHERGARLEDPVHLAHRAVEVGFVVERVVRHHDVDRAAGGEAEVGQVAVVALDGDLRRRRRAAQVGDAVGIRIEGDRLRTRLREGDRVAGDAQLDDAPPPRDVAEQVQLVVARHPGAVGHVPAHRVTVWRPRHRMPAIGAHRAGPAR
jgi:hypothetical protein